MCKEIKFGEKLKFLRNFDYILFSFIFSKVKSDMRKLFSLVFFLFLILFRFQIEP